MTKAELGERLEEEKNKFCSQFQLCSDCPLYKNIKGKDMCDKLTEMFDRMKGI